MGPPVVETVQELMARAKHFPKPPRNAELEKDHRRPLHLKPNPNALPGMRYPADPYTGSTGPQSIFDVRDIAQPGVPRPDSRTGAPQDPASLSAFGGGTNDDPFGGMRPNAGINPDFGPPPTSPNVTLRPGVDFLGGDFNNSGFAPPDTMGAVGPDQYVTIINGLIKVYDKTGSSTVINMSTDTFFSSVLPSGQFTSDPRVVFDPHSQAWFITMISAPNSPDTVMVAVCTTSHISSSSSFHFYSFVQDFGQTGMQDTGGFADYDTLGVDENALYIGCNMFEADSSFNTTGFVIPKAQLLSGSMGTVFALRGLIDNTGFGPYTPQGVTNFVDASQGTGYFIGIDDGTGGQLDLVKVANPTTSPTATKTKINVNAYDGPVAVTIPGSGTPLDPDDQRLMGATMQYTVTTGKTSLWTSHHIGTNSSGVSNGSDTQNAARWYEINIPAATLRQSGTLYDPSGSSYIYPTIAGNDQGHAVMGWTQAGPSTNPTIEAARRFQWSVLGLMGQSGQFESFLNGGAFTYTLPSNFDVQNGMHRWGDYSYVNLDPSDGMTLWMTQEYVPGNNDWGCQVFSVINPPPPPMGTITPSMVAQGYSGNLFVQASAYGPCSFFRANVFDPNPWKKDVSVVFSQGANNYNFVNGTIRNPWYTQLNVPALIPSNQALGSYNFLETNPDGQTTSGTNVLTVVPPLASFGVNQNSVTAGGTVQGTLTLGANANVNEPISLTTNATPGYGLTFPSSVAVPSGSNTVNFTIQSLSVQSAETVTITASDPGTVHSFQQTITINPAGTTPGVSALAVSANSTYGGQQVTGTVTLSSAATSTVAVALASSDTTKATVPSSVNVTSGNTQANFTIQTLLQSAAGNVTITAGVYPTTGTQTIALSKLSLTNFTGSASVIAGQPFSGTFTFNGPTEQPNGSAITLKNDNLSAFSFSSYTVTTTPGSTTKTITPATSHVSSSQTAHLTATFNGATFTVTTTVQPASIIGIGANPNSIHSTNQTTFTVTLNGFAPAGGTVTLQSNNTSALPVPASVSISNNWKATFTATAGTVTSNTTVTITATYLGVPKTTTVTVQP